MQVRVPHSPTLNSPQAAPRSRVFITLSLFSSLQLQATRSLMVLLKPCLAGEGAVNLALSQESCGRPSRRGPGSAVALVPALVSGTFLYLSNPLTVWFFFFFWCPLYFLVSYLHKCRWLFALFLSRSARCFTHVQGKVDSAPTYLATIFQSPEIFFIEIVNHHHRKAFLNKGKKRNFLLSITF